MGIFRLILALIHVGLLLLLGATLLNAYIPPSVFAYLNLLSLAFPFLMIFNLLLCIFWIVSRKKRAIIFILLNLAFINPVRSWVNFSSEKNRVKDFKVLSFNNKVNLFGKENVEDYVQSFNADIVFLQEAGMNQNGNPELSDFPYSFHNPVISFYSKYKIVEQGNIPLPEIGEAQYADVKIKGRIIRFVNVYLEPFQLKKSMVKPTSDINENEEKAKGLLKRFLPIFMVHEEQVNILEEFVAASPYPVVLAGDFNSMPNSYEYYRINKVLKDAFVESGKGFSTSFHDYKFPIRIDYIFCSDELETKTYSVDRSQKLSDHYPVVASFKFKD